MHLEILDSKRKEFLPKLGFLKDHGFYMAGGTALALQIGHRTSLDFDFYTDKKFDSEELHQKLREQFDDIIVLRKKENTLIVEMNKIVTSFFYYPYPLISPCVEFEKVCFACKEDIAAMKIIAISDRGTKRDFIDIYFLLKEFSLEDIFGFVRQKYPEFNVYTGLRGLTYFVDAEKKQNRRLYMFNFVSWPEVKKFIIQKVKEYKKNA
jgi:hypothetical protein